MRIALLAHCRHPIAEPYQGGLEMHTALLADALVRRGHRVVLLAKEGSRTDADLLPLLPRDSRPGPAHDLAHDAALRAAVPDLDVDVVLNNSLSPVPYLAFAELPMLTVLHTPATLERVVDVVTRPDWRPSPRHRWIGVSSLTSADWRRLLPAVDWVPNGIDLAHWAPRTDRRPRHRRAVWSGRITPEKGLPLAIEAARLAGFSLAISGPVADREHFRTQIAPRLDHRVRYVGHLHHRALPGFLQSGAAYVFSPVWPEPFGLALVEALAAGTPAAALPSGAVPEILTTDGGVIADRCDAPALAAAMITAVGRDRRTVAASVARFDRRTMIDAYEARLAALVAEPPAVEVKMNYAERTTPCR